MSFTGLPYKKDLQIYVGDRTTFSFLWETEDIVEGVSTKVPVDLTGGTLAMTFSMEFGTKLLQVLPNLITDYTLGLFSFTLSEEDTRILGNSYHTRVLEYDIEFVGSAIQDPTHTTVLKGKVTLSVDVSRTEPPVDPAVLVPINTTPYNAANAPGGTVVQLISNSFATSGGEQDHVSSQWQAGSLNFAEIYFDSGVDTENLESIEATGWPLLTTVYWRVRHQGSVTGFSEYSNPTRFTTTPTVFVSAEDVNVVTNDDIESGDVQSVLEDLAAVSTVTQLDSVAHGLQLASIEDTLTDIENYSIATNGTSLSVNQRHYIASNVNAFLPNLDDINEGDSVTVSVKLGTTPTVSTVGSQVIRDLYGILQSVLTMTFDSETNFIKTGMEWELLASQEMNGGTF